MLSATFSKHVAYCQRSSGHQVHHAARMRLYQRVCATPEELGGVDGDSGLQESLVAQLRMQIETQTLKDEIMQDLEGKKEDIKQLGEEVRALMATGMASSGIHTVSCTYEAHRHSTTRSLAVLCPNKTSCMVMVASSLSTYGCAHHELNCDKPRG